MYICRLLSQHPHLGCDVVPKLGPLKRSPKAPIHARGVPREIPPSYAFAACQQRMRPAPQATPQAAQSRCGASWWDHRCSIAVVVRQDRPKKPAIKWGYNLTPLILGVHPLPCQSSQPFWMKHKSCIYIYYYIIYCIHWFFVIYANISIF